VADRRDKISMLRKGVIEGGVAGTDMLFTGASDNIVGRKTGLT
jgi:hypothetical protein